MLNIEPPSLTTGTGVESCEYCDSPRPRFVRYKDRDQTFSLTRDRLVGMYKCDVCGLYFAYPKPTPEELRDFFAGEYYSAKYGEALVSALAIYPPNGTAASHLKDIRRRAKDVLYTIAGKRRLNIATLLRKHMRSLARRPVVIEIGGGISPLLYLGKEGFFYTCVEPSAITVKVFNEKGYDNIVRGFAEELPGIRTGSADAILYIKTLAHVSDLTKSLSEARRALKDGGILLIADSNGDLESPESLASGYAYYVFTEHFLSGSIKDFTIVDRIDVDDNWSIVHGAGKAVFVLRKNERR